MTIFIGVTTQSEGSVVSVDGWLQGDEADELLRVVGSAAPPVVLDLTDLRSADKHGVTAIRQLAEDGVEVIGASDYLALLLETESSIDRYESSGGGEVK